MGEKIYLRFEVNRILWNELPETPGIYQFFDEKDRLLYIGKSKNLRKRVRSYFRKQSEEVQERTLIMIRNINYVLIEQSDTELEALILEDDLIKKYLPTYNVKQKKFREQVYLTISSDDFPTIQIVGNDQIDFTQHIFGPFKDKYAAEHILYVFRKTLKLRNCSDSKPTKKCLLAGIDKCLGPCVEQITSFEYKKFVKIAAEFLEGKFEKITEILDSQIQAKASELDFEEAAKLRDLKEFCINFCKRQTFMQEFMHQNVAIQKDKFSFVFQKGELKKIYKKKFSEISFQRFLEGSAKLDEKSEPHQLMDRAYVVWVWVKQNKAKYQVLS
jgi:excinuclease ABC subunit C